MVGCRHARPAGRVAYPEAVGDLGDGSDLGPPPTEPRRTLGRLSRLEFALRNAIDVDAVARAVLRDLVSLPGVVRVGIALTEGGGRRLRFLAAEAGDATAEWCHIDAYDDVPLTAVVRTGEPVLGNLDGLGGRFAGVVERQRAAGNRALAALPLPGTGSPIGGVIVFFDEEQHFGGPQRRLLEAAARRTSEAVRRVRLAVGLQDDTAGAPEGEHSVLLVLDDDPRSAGVARRFLRTQLDEWQVGGDVPDTAELLLSELVTNAVIHAGTTSVLTLALETGLLTVAVRDRGPVGAEPSVQLVDVDDPLRVFGRGLQLVDALADRWGSDQDPHGTTSWFALEVAG
jgi:anti-sigma regulatory factor (Ser/Thr protein kinase)